VEDVRDARIIAAQYSTVGRVGGTVSLGSGFA
jgi:hypothetical protein